MPQSLKDPKNHKELHFGKMKLSAPLCYSALVAGFFNELLK
jgi:hypothetical protein